METELKWSIHTIDAYKPLDDPTGWLVCPKCGELPRVWAFDNGLTAKCCCGELYGLPQAKAESINSVYKRTGSTGEYSRDALRDAWNMRIETGVDQNKLTEGRW